MIDQGAPMSPEVQALNKALTDSITNMLMYAVKIELGKQIKEAAEAYKLPAEAIDMASAKAGAERRVAKLLRHLADTLDA